ncbi:hypothetical protein PR048_027050 [Dryococelus australis]|uniref:Uncharacterized protein n=1 Tax=Dryococelus australis TaxID=614101 RepID=A0ABQ9GGJ0_9NEOP|nr:hypothetical protein PR048_027050 [Dryococelus australis]
MLPILPCLKTYFKSKGAQLPDTYSVKKSAEILEDCLLLPKLHLLMIPLVPNTKAYAPFPTFGCRKPDLIVNGEAHIKLTILESTLTTYKLINVDVENIGPVARQSLDEARVKEVYMEKYRQETENCLVKKIHLLVLIPKQCKADFETCVGMLLANRHVTAILVDQAILQFGRFASHTDKTEFSKFERTRQFLCQTI